MSKEKQRKLFLIDGNSLAYRAFFALPESISTSSGVPTNAIFGFSTMLIKILSEYGSRATIVAWDAGMSGREERYPEYKAQRPPRPDALSQQWPNFAPLVDAFGYTNVKIDNWEADDVIASIAELAKREGIDVTIVTGDRDAFQLIDDGNGSGSVTVMTTTKGVSETKTYDRSAVVERWGVAPELVPDLIGLKGDSSDNIPGVPGIGDKTAAELLQRFGSLEQVLASIDEISGPKRKQNLSENSELARLSKELATLNREIDCGVSTAEVMGNTPDLEKLKSYFMELELREPLRRLRQTLDLDDQRVDGQKEDASTQPETGEQTLFGGAVDGGTPGDEAESVGLTNLPDLIPLKGAALAAASDDGARSINWSAAWEDGAAAGKAEDLTQLIEAWGEAPLLVHDYKSVVRKLCDIDRQWPQPRDLAHDTLLAAFLINPLYRHYDLEFLCEQEGMSVPDDGVSLSEKAALEYQLSIRQRLALTENGLDRLFDEIELPLLRVLCAMEQIGVALDSERLAAISSQVGSELEALESEIWEVAGHEFTIGSPQQLGQVLFEELGLTRKRRGKTGYSTDAKVLRSIREEHAIVAKVERWRELSKLQNTYLDALPGWLSERTGRLHTTFHQVGASTGRISSSNPNLQNIPIRTELGRQIRGCFVAAEGMQLLAADYSQVELRVLAALADDKALKEIFARGEDVHVMTAAEVFGLDPSEVEPEHRSRAKAVNFGIVYGLTPHGLSEQLSIGFEEAKEYIDAYLGRFPGVRVFIEKTIASAAELGYVRTHFGRVREIPELRAREPHRRQLGERLAVNTVIQGTAADLIKIAMVASHAALIDAGLQARLVLQIHDELVFECSQAESEQASDIIAAKMVDAWDLEPALEVDVGVGADWLEAKI